jgi:branched-chain amino acid aminotransferase
MQLDYSAEEIAAAVKETIRANRPAEAAAIRVLGYYSVVTLEVDRPAGPLDLFVMAADAARLGEAPDGRTIAACFSTWRKLSGDMVPVEAKTAANYLNGMMVREDAKSRGFDQGITLDADGAVAEGSTESVFMVKDGVLRTPPLGRILRSITRLTIIEAARADGLVVDDGPVAPEEMLAADEIFTACTPLKVLPVHRFEDRDLTAPGPVTSRLDALLADICRGRDERFKDWLFPVD